MRCFPNFRIYILLLECSIIYLYSFVLLCSSCSHFHYSHHSHHSQQTQQTQQAQWSLLAQLFFLAYLNGLRFVISF